MNLCFLCIETCFVNNNKNICKFFKSFYCIWEMNNVLYDSFVFYSLSKKETTNNKKGCCDFNLKMPTYIFV